MREIKYIILHCTAGPQDQPTKDILHFWKAVKGWKSPGYHYLISADGTYENLQPIEKQSNGVEGYNAHSINICYKGGVVTDNSNPVNSKGTPIDNRTDEQKSAMEFLVKKFNLEFPKAIITGHRDFSPDKNRNGVVEPSEWKKACPSFSVKTWLDEFEFISATPVIYLFTTGSNVNIRSGPGKAFAKVGEPLAKGVKMKKISSQDGWSYVDYNGLKGWVIEQYLA